MRTAIQRTLCKPAHLRLVFGDANMCRWVEDTLQKNKSFDAEGLVAQDPSYKDRLRYWNNEMCAKKPHTFEICVAVG